MIDVEHALRYSTHMIVTCFGQIDFEIRNDSCIVNEDYHSELNEITCIHVSDIDGKEKYLNIFLKTYESLMPNLKEICCSGTNIVLKYIPKTVIKVSSSYVDPDYLWEIEELSLWINDFDTVINIINIDLSKIKKLYVGVNYIIDFSQLVNLEVFQIVFNSSDKISNFNDIHIQSNVLTANYSYFGTYELPISLKGLKYYVKKETDLSYLRNLNELTLVFINDIPVKLSNEYISKLTLEFRINGLGILDLDFPNISSLDVIISFHMAISPIIIDEYFGINTIKLIHNLLKPMCKKLFIMNFDYDFDLEMEYVEFLRIINRNEISRSIREQNFNCKITSESVKSLNIQNVNIEFNLPNLNKFTLINTNFACIIKNLENHVIDTFDIVNYHQAEITVLNTRINQLQIYNQTHKELDKLTISTNYETLELKNCYAPKMIHHELVSLNIFYYLQYRANFELSIFDKIFRPNLKKVTSNIDFSNFLELSDNCEVELKID